MSAEQLEKSREILPIAPVQNRYNPTVRSSESVLEACERAGKAYHAPVPLATGNLARPGGPLDEIPARHDATPSQAALAWLLARSPVVLPSPAPAPVGRPEGNVAAANLRLETEEPATLSGEKRAEQTRTTS